MSLFLSCALTIALLLLGEPLLLAAIAGFALGYALPVMARVLWHSLHCRPDTLFYAAFGVGLIFLLPTAFVVACFWLWVPAHDTALHVAMGAARLETYANPFVDGGCLSFLILVAVGLLACCTQVVDWLSGVSRKKLIRAFSPTHYPSA